MNRKHLFAIAAGSIAVAFAALSSVAGPRLGDWKMRMSAEITAPRPNQTQHASVPPVETTGFETPDWDPYTPGQSNYVCGSAYWATCTPPPLPTSATGACLGSPALDKNCAHDCPNALNGWYNSGSSQHCREPHIEIAHPATGSQHLRFVRDPQGGNPAGCVGFTGACRENAFTPDLGPQVVGPTTVNFDISGTPFGQHFAYFSIGTDGGLGTYVYFYAGGLVYAVDPATYNFVAHTNWAQDGSYRNVRVEKDPCANTVKYFYDGVQFFQAASNFETLDLQRAIMLTNNQSGTWDIDNYSVQRAAACPTVCGNGVFEPGEGCEPSVSGSGDCPPGRCVAAGQPNECTCTPICTLSQPCAIRNGSNGPYLSPFDPLYGGIFFYSGSTPNVEFDTCGSNADTVFYAYDNNDPNPQALPVCKNDDCCGIPGTCGPTGRDPNAACFDAPPPAGFASCSCCSTASVTDYFIQLLQSGNTQLPAGSSIMWNVAKKSVCAGEELGSCCINNGPNFGCRDDILQSSCTGVFSNQKCVDRAPCVCVPNCTGRVCGSDGCGGSCGTCPDDNNVCNGTETCDQAGQCGHSNPLNCPGDACNTAGCNPLTGCNTTPVNCDDSNACTIDSCALPNGCAHAPRSCDDGLACNGVETCNPASGCVAGTPIDCDDGVDCTVDACDETVDGNCTHDDSHCFTPIPTVSQWGVAVMALLLLIGAKIYFTRRQSASA